MFNEIKSNKDKYITAYNEIDFNLYSINARRNYNSKLSALTSIGGNSHNLFNETTLEEEALARTCSLRSSLATKIYETTTTLYGNICSEAIRWCDFDVNEIKFPNVSENSGWIRHKNESLLKMFYSFCSDKNKQFYSTVQNTISDAFTYGTGSRRAVFSYKPNGELDLNIEAISQYKLFYKKNKIGNRIVTAYEEEFCIGELMKKFPISTCLDILNFKTEEELKNFLCNTSSENLKVNLINMVFDREYLPYDYGRTKSKYISVYLIKDAVQGRNKSDEFCYIDNELDFDIYTAFEFIKNCNENYGSSLLFYMLGDIVYKDMLLHSLRMNIEYRANPSFVTNDLSAIPNSKYLPGMIFGYGPNTPFGGDLFKRIDMGGDINIPDIILDKKSNEIEKGLIYSRRLMPEQTAGMTETQVAELMVNHELLMFPVVSNWDSGDMRIIANNILKYLYAPNGGGLNFPYHLFNSSAADDEQVQSITEYIAPSFAGILGKEQKNYDNVRTNQFVQDLANISQLNSEILDVIDFDKIIKIKEKNLGISEKIIKDDDDKGVAQKRADRQQDKANQDYMLGQETQLKINEALNNK